MQNLCEEQKKRDIAEALDLFAQLPDDLKGAALDYMREMVMSCSSAGTQ